MGILQAEYIASVNRFVERYEQAGLSRLQAPQVIVLYRGRPVLLERHADFFTIAGCLVYLICLKSSCFNIPSRSHILTICRAMYVLMCWNLSINFYVHFSTWYTHVFVSTVLPYKGRWWSISSHLYLVTRWLCLAEKKGGLLSSQPSSL